MFGSKEKLKYEEGPEKRRPIKVRWAEWELWEIDVALGEGEDFSVLAREILLGEPAGPEPYVRPMRKVTPCDPSAPVRRRRPPAPSLFQPRD